MSEPASGQAGGARAKIRVFLIDDHEVVRRGLKGLLEAEADIDVVGEAGDSESALAGLKAVQPDVALLDIRLPDGDGVTLCREIRSALPGTACLILTAYSDDQAMMGAIVAGAAGYVMKQTPGSELIGAVRTVAAGQSTLDAHTAQRVIERLRERASGPDPAAALSGQEKRVLELIGEGLTNRQIAEQMFLSEKTAKNYVSSLLAKLGMQRRSQAAAFAARMTAAPGD
jgi:two-component system, NarL family, response regulator DevR